MTTEHFDIEQLEPMTSPEADKNNVVSFAEAQRVPRSHYNHAVARAATADIILLPTQLAVDYDGSTIAAIEEQIRVIQDESRRYYRQLREIAMRAEELIELHAVADGVHPSTIRHYFSKAQQQDIDTMQQRILEIDAECEWLAERRQQVFERQVTREEAIAKREYSEMSIDN